MNLWVLSAQKCSKYSKAPLLEARREEGLSYLCWDVWVWSCLLVLSMNND